MKKRIGAICTVIMLSLSLFGCGKLNYGDTKDTKRKFANNYSDRIRLREEYEYNFNNLMVATGEASELMLVYMVGSNLESEAGLASLDIEEMQNSKFDNENIKILICTG